MQYLMIYRNENGELAGVFIDLEGREIRYSPPTAQFEIETKDGKGLQPNEVFFCSWCDNQPQYVGTFQAAFRPQPHEDFRHCSNAYELIKELDKDNCTLEFTEDMVAHLKQDGFLTEDGLPASKSVGSKLEGTFQFDVDARSKTVKPVYH